ncbi:helicase associated domain-containing protein [Streptomyces sp. Tue6028]|uniref:helicase associated domain-containing protein n=1 Tax=Streptomyces sp. Tue6028 TaxID=2036037 RepID=UPI003D728130
MIGVEPPVEGESVVPARRSQDERWAVILAAARQFHARESHLIEPRKLVEPVAGEPVELGSFLDNAHRRARKLSDQRRADLDELGMRRALLFPGRARRNGGVTLLPSGAQKES